ncbi:hypothetical protein EDB89DRAFT_549142 [Lactarius sanguifluus]|nr:hypothetical protein EDB89DRAFT_549142 [Lactarius sanguifluus]
MSQAEVPHETINLGDRAERGIGDRDDQSTENQTLEESNFVDGSGPLFSIYTEMAEEHDKKQAERWKADADGILIFTGLFSAAVATLVSVSIQDLRPNSQDTTAFYLANIYQLLADANGSQVSIPSTLSNPASSFTPSKYAIWVNTLWFLSLAISLTCALLATLLQQWVRRYIKLTQARSSPHTRGRIRAFFSEGVDNFRLPRVVDALPILLHLSLFLFFAGLLVFLFNIDHTAFSAIASWVGLCTAIYVSITFMPLVRYNSPYYSPLSSSAWLLITGVLTLLFQALWWLAGFTCVNRRRWVYFDKRRKHYHEWFTHGLAKTATEFARKLSPEMDGRALMWTLDRSDEDQELGRFFAGIPGFCRSKVLNDPIGTCIKPNMERMTAVLIGLFHRTLTSNLVAPKTREQRLAICREAMSAASLPISSQIFHRVINAEWDGLLSSVEFGIFLGKTDRSDPVTAYHSKAILSIILPRVQGRDECWFRLAADHLGCSRSDLNDYLRHGDSISLAASIHILRNIIYDHFEPFSLGDATTRWKVLELVSKFDIRGTLPTLQHDFCDLWNEIALLASDPDHRLRSVYIAILRNVRGAYIALHHDTNSAPTKFSSSTADDDHVLMFSYSYPLCKVSDHHLHPTSRTDYRPVPPRAPSFPIPFPDHSISQLACYIAPSPAPQNVVVPSGCVPPITQINVNQFPGIVTPTSDSIPNGPAANTTIILSAPSSVLVAAVPHSVIPDTPPAFPVPVHDVLKPSLVPQLPADPAASRLDHAPLGPDTDSSALVTTSPVAPPRSTSTSDRGATTDDGNGAKVALRNDKATSPHSVDPVTYYDLPA